MHTTDKRILELDLLHTTESKTSIDYKTLYKRILELGLLHTESKTSIDYKTF